MDFLSKYDALKYSDDAFIVVRDNEIIFLNEKADANLGPIESKFDFYTRADEGDFVSNGISFSYKRFYAENGDLIFRFKDKSNEWELSEKLKEANETLDIRKAFLKHISHEIKTPMNAISGLSELIMEESKGRKVYDFATDINTASATLLEMVNDIIDWVGSYNFSNEVLSNEYETEAVFEKLLHLSAIQFSSMGKRLKKDISGNLPCRLSGDEKKISLIVTAFSMFLAERVSLGAIKVSVSHKGLPENKARINLTYTDENDNLDIDEIKNTLGYLGEDNRMEREILDKVGLAVVMAARFIRVMDGDIKADKNIDGHTTLTVGFIQEVIDERTITEVPRAKSMMKERFMSFGLVGLKVLLVDDNKINRKVAAGLISAYGCEVDEAKSGKQALDLISKQNYDLIFMDHMMPEMDGIEATSIIRNEFGEYGRNVIIVAITANALGDAKNMYLKAGFNGFISKPLNKTRLDDLLDALVPDDKKSEAFDKGINEAFTDDISDLFITGIDIKEGLRLHSGGVKDYLELLSLFYADGMEKADYIQILADDKDMDNYRIEVHGLKSAAANIGALELSKMAKNHEYAAIEKDVVYVNNNAFKLVSEYKFLINEIKIALDNRGISFDYSLKKDDKRHFEEIGLEELKNRIIAIKEAVNDFRSKDARAMIEELLNICYDNTILQSLKDARNKIKMYDDDAAEEILTNILNSL